MYAVVRTGGKQYRVEAGHELLVEKLPAEMGQKIQLEDVLMVADGANVMIGKPKVSAKVECIVLSQEKGPKLRTIKYKRRHNYKKTYGHRQDLTRLRIEKIATA